MGSTASLDRSPRKNWVENTKPGLPGYIREIARSIHEKRGMPLDRAIPVAISTVKRWAAGRGDVKPDTRAKAAKAVASWEALRATNKARQVSTSNTDDLAQIIELSRRVRTEAGVRRYGRPIGSPIGRGTGGPNTSNGSSSGRSRSGSSSGASGGRSTVGKIGAGARADSRGKALPKGQRTGADYVREGLARQERKRAVHAGKSDADLRKRQREIAKTWVQGKAGGKSATSPEQRKLKAEGNEIRAELARRREGKPSGAVGKDATPADRLARMGEMERRGALREMSDGDLKSARSELSARESSGKPSGTKAAVNAEIARRANGKSDGKSSAQSSGTTTKDTPERPSGTTTKDSTPKSDGDRQREKLPGRSDSQLDGIQRRARDEVRKGNGGKSTTDAQKTATAVSDERNRRRDVAKAAVAKSNAAGKPTAAEYRDKAARLRAVADASQARRREIRAEERAASKTSTEKPSAAPAAPAAPPTKAPAERPASTPGKTAAAKPTTTRQDDTVAVGPDRAPRNSEPNPNRFVDDTSDADIAAMGDALDRDRTPTPAGSPAAPGPRLDRMTDAQLGAMDDALTKRGGPESERHAAIKAERARRAGDPAREQAQPPASAGAAKRSPAAPQTGQPGSAPTAAASPGTKTPAKPTAPGKAGQATETERPGVAKAAPAAPAGSTTGTTDPPRSPGRTGSGVNGGQAGQDAPRGRRADSTPRTLGDDEDDELSAWGRKKAEERRARGEKLPDPFADEEPTTPSTSQRPAGSADTPARPAATPAPGARLQEYARTRDEAARSQLVGQMSPAELDALSAALDRASGRAGDDQTRGVLQARRGEVDRAKMAQRTAGMTDRPAANEQDRQTPGRPAPAAIPAAQSRAQVAPPQATSRPAGPGDARSGRIPDNRATQVTGQPDRPMGREQPPVPAQRPAPDGDGIGGAPNLSRLEQLNDQQLAASVQRAQQRVRAAQQADPSRSGLPFTDAKTALGTLQREQARRQGANTPAAPAGAPAPEFNANRLNTGDRVALTGTQWRAPGDAEIIQTRTDGYVVRRDDGREEFVETSDIAGPGGAQAPGRDVGAATAAATGERLPDPNAGRMQADPFNPPVTPAAAPPPMRSVRATDSNGKIPRRQVPAQQQAPTGPLAEPAPQGPDPGVQVATLQQALARETDAAKREAIRRRIDVLRKRGPGGAPQPGEQQTLMSQRRDTAIELAAVIDAAEPERTARPSNGRYATVRGDGSRGASLVGALGLGGL